MSHPRFHLAIPVSDLATCRAFYANVLGLSEGRSDRTWVDFDLYGHQLVLHEIQVDTAIAGRNPVDGDAVPVPHFGVILSITAWQALASRLRAEGVSFVIEPHVRFEGLPGEQHTMFFLDPSGNALEFKAFADDRQVFAASSP